MAMQPTHPHLGRFGYRLSYPVIKRALYWLNLHQVDSPYAQTKITSMQDKLKRGEPLYLLGLGAGGHNAGVSLVEITGTNGIRLICNNEEERFTGLKHYADYPEQSVVDLLGQLQRLNLRPTDIHACLTSWDYIALLSHSVRTFLEEFPHNIDLLKPQPRTTFITDYQAVLQALSAPYRLSKQLGLSMEMPLINLRHHDNHAYFAYAVSPFAQSTEPTLVMVIDGSGDDGSISVYLGYQNRVILIYHNGSMFDSLGTFYSMISSTQGGWSPLSSEGRYMGASAWGDNNRLTNPYYQSLRHIFHFARSGEIRLNRTLANWHRAGYSNPYTPALTKLLGSPILPADFWNPDRVLQVADVANKHPSATHHHVDKAAATQLIFEDVLFHIVRHFIQQTGSHQLVLSGGTALNCVANMGLLEKFDETYYERHLRRRNSRLQLWVPPIPGDAGTPVGAAYHFGLRFGQSKQRESFSLWAKPLTHAFYCGLPPTATDIKTALEQTPDIGWDYLGNINEARQLTEIADLLAYLIAQNGIMGLYQGVAETGPRALGHRSIVANPSEPTMRHQLNERVKYREIIRPLAPMLTFEAAQRWFVLSPGAKADYYNAYNYMVLTALAKPAAYQHIPAVIHRDGTARLQIVRPEVDPFTYSYLQALQRYIGVAVSVNTSLNVGSPIVQIPTQALTALCRSNGLTGLLLISETGDTFLAWHMVVDLPKDGGQQLQVWRSAWVNKQ